MLAAQDCPIVPGPADLAALKPRLFTAWSALDYAPHIFRYRLHVQHERTLPGPFGFLAQLNPDRTTKRRPPQTLLCVRAAFNPAAFNFNHINSGELLFELPHRGTRVSFLVNNSPLTPQHTLICPDRADCLPQMLAASGSIRLAIDMLHSFADRTVRIGYNSPGAWASVNHLHLHLVLVPQSLYVERVTLEPLIGGLCRIGGAHPVDGFAFEVANAEPLIERCSADVGRLVRLLCDRNIPHNLVWTLASSSSAGGSPMVRIFVFAKARQSATKVFDSFNIAFCELAGYVPMGNSEEYERLTEEAVVRKMQEDVGDVCERIVAEVVELFARHE